MFVGAFENALVVLGVLVDFAREAGLTVEYLVTCAFISAFVVFGFLVNRTLFTSLPNPEFPLINTLIQTSIPVFILVIWAVVLAQSIETFVQIGTLL